MKKQCSICTRGAIKGASRSHSNIKTLRRLYVNLQRRWLDGGRVLICTRCIKTVNKAPVRPRVAAAASAKK